MSYIVILTSFTAIFPAIGYGQTDIESFYEYFYDCYDKLCLESPNSAFIVAGDFNPTSNGFQNRCLKAHCNLKQVVKKATRGNNILDLIFTNIALIADFLSKCFTVIYI